MSKIKSLTRAEEEIMQYIWQGFVDHKSYGRTYEYFPLISKEEYSKGSVLSLINEYFNGSTPQLVSFLVAKEETSIEELQELIKELKKKS